MADIVNWNGAKFLAIRVAPRWWGPYATMRTATTIRPAKTKAIPPCPATSRWILPLSSSSSFIASGCSSPATLRRSASGRSTAVPSTTRSLPMVKDVAQFVAGRAAESRPQPNRSISLQETHSGAGLEELKKEPMKKRHLALILWTTSPRPFSTTTKKIRLFRPSVRLFVLF